MTALATDPVIRTNADAATYLTSVQVKKWKQTYSRAGQIGWAQSLLHGYGSMKLSEVLARIGEAFDATAAKVTAKTGMTYEASATNPLFQARTLEDVNGIMASNFAAGMPSSAVRDVAIRLGANPAAGDNEFRVVYAIHLSEQANALGIVFDDWIEAYKKDPNANPLDLTGQAYTAAVPTGSGKNFFEQVKYFVRHPLKVLRGVQTDAGEWVAERAQDILNADKNAPWLSNYLLKPLGFHAQLTLIRELGNVVADGSVSAFNEKALGLSVAGTLTAAGQALLVAAPFLPPPWNVLAAAAGALSIAAGNVMTHLITKEDAKRQAQAQAEAASAQASAQATAQAQAEAESVTYAYAWANFGTGVLYWTAFLADGFGRPVFRANGEPVPMFVFLTDRGWVEL